MIAIGLGRLRHCPACYQPSTCPGPASTQLLQPDGPEQTIQLRYGDLPEAAEPEDTTHSQAMPLPLPASGLRSRYWLMASMACPCRCILFQSEDSRAVMVSRVSILHPPACRFAPTIFERDLGSCAQFVDAKAALSAISMAVWGRLHFPRSLAGGSPHDEPKPRRLAGYHLIYPRSSAVACTCRGGCAGLSPRAHDRL